MSSDHRGELFCSCRVRERDARSGRDRSARSDAAPRCGRAQLWWDNGLVSRRERDVRRDALAETRIERSAPRTRRRGALGTHEPRAWPFREKTRFLEVELEVMLGSRARNPRLRVRPSSFARVCAVVSVRENPRFGEQTVFADFAIRARIVSQIKMSNTTQKTQKERSADCGHDSPQSTRAFLRMDGATRPEAHNTARVDRRRRRDQRRIASSLVSR